MHVVLVLGLAAITFHVELVQFVRGKPIPEQTLHYVRLAPVPPAISPPARRGGNLGAAASARIASAARLTAPSMTPVGIPKPAAPTVAPGVMDGTRRDRDSSVAVGVQPGIPDSRLAINPIEPGHLPRTDAQKADSALSAIYGMYVDSVKASLAHHGRDPGDWSWGGKDGDKWGWDPNGIHLGGITIPNAVLAALPLNMGPTGHNMNALTEGRADAYMRQDIAMHANLMSEDDFRSAVKRIRDRVDRERQEKMAKQRKDQPPPQ
jgi:hypothetical protein